MTGPPARLEFVVAVAENDVIGRDGGLPWHLPADLRHFRALTLGHCILMGRKTYESIGKPLPGRRNLVLTRSAVFAAAGCETVASVEAAVEIAARDPVMIQPLMIVGGAEVYALALPFATRIHLTLVHTRIEAGDARFSAWRAPEWRETERVAHAPDAANGFAYTFVTLERG